MTGVADSPDNRLLTGRFVVVILSGLCYFAAMGTLVPTVPRYADKVLHAGSIGVGVAVGALAIGAIALRPIAGRVGDRFGRRVLMIVGAVVVGAMATVSGLVETLPWLIGTRIVLGLGEACFFVGATTMATDLAPVTRRGEAVSYLSVATWGGLALGPVLGEAVLGGSHYQRVWLTTTVLAFAAALIACVTRETHRGSVDMERGRLVHPAALRPGILMALSLLGLIGFNAFVALYGPTVGVNDIGLVFLLYGIVVLGVRVFGARLPDVLGPRRAGSMAMLSTIIGLAVVAVWHAEGGLLVGTVFLAIGSSFLYPAMLLLALTGIPENERGSVVGTFSAFFDFANGAGGFMLGAAVALTSYAGAFGLGAVLAAVSLVMLRSGFGREQERLGAEVAPAAGT